MLAWSLPLQINGESLKSSQLEEVVETCFLTPTDGWPGETNCIWGVNPLIWGEPGIGKSARAKYIAAHLGVTLREVFCGQHPPEDFSGALIPDGKGGASSICSLDAIRYLCDKGIGVLFLDEVNQAPPATQGAVMAVTHARQAGGTRIPGRVRILSAANPEEIATGGYKLSPALANRYFHFDDDMPTSAEFSAYMIGRVRRTNIQVRPIEKLESLVTTEWPNKFPESVGLITGFLHKNGMMIHKRPPIQHDDSGRSWPSHRMWEQVTRAITTSKILGKPQIIRDALITGGVGQGAARALITYERDADLPDPIDMLTKGWPVDTRRLDITMAAYSTMVSYVTGRPDRKEQLELAVPCWEMLLQLVDGRSGLADIAVPQVDALVEATLARNSKNKEILEAAKKVYVPLGLSNIGKYMDAT